ncbi:MAG: hypothetical protein ACRC5H_10645 [Treponemataceae bacterium]
MNNIQKNTIKKILFAFVSMTFLAACSTVNVSYFASPNINRASINKVVVFAPIHNIGWRKNTEKYLLNEFSRNGINAISSLQIISPLETYTDKEISAIFEENKVDAILVINLVDSYEQKTYVPEQTTFSYQTYTRDNKVYVKQLVSTTPSYVRITPKAVFEMNLFELSSNKLTLKATANTTGGDFSGMDSILKSLAKKMVALYMSQP